MKSIMQVKDGSCYLCGILNGDYSEKYVEEHHCIYGSANRKLSERFGLKVYLCPEHHRVGKESIHGGNTELNLKLKQAAQVAFEKHNPKLNFREIFGVNYFYQGEFEND